jgi:hypothetical protein
MEPLPPVWEKVLMWRSQQQLKSLRYTLTHPQQILPWFQSMIPRILHPELIPVLLWHSASQALKPVFLPWLQPMVIIMSTISDTGNRTPVSRVTGGDTSHYTMSDLYDDSKGLRTFLLVQAIRYCL